MSKPEAFSRPNNTGMTCDTSYHPLPVSRIKQDENMQAVDGSEKVLKYHKLNIVCNCCFNITSGWFEICGYNRSTADVLFVF